MTLDPRAKRILDMMALSGTKPTTTPFIAGRREGLAKLMAMGSKPIATAQVENLTIPSPGKQIDLRIYRPASILHTLAPAIVFLHGGGLVAGGLDTHDGICRGLANNADCIVVSVDYRLAPEHKFPAALEDAGFAVDWIWKQARTLGINPRYIAVAGESAGALLAALVCNGYRKVEAPIKAMLLLCPVIDLAGQFTSRTEYGSGYYLIDAATVQHDIECCLKAGAVAGDLPSPLRNGNTNCLPPTIIVAAECDPFRDEAKLYADTLAEAGVTVQYTCHAGMIHSFFGLNAMLPQADPALRSAALQLKALLT